MHGPRHQVLPAKWQRIVGQSRCGEFLDISGFQIMFAIARRERTIATRWQPHGTTSVHCTPVARHHLTLCPLASRSVEPSDSETGGKPSVARENPPLAHAGFESLTSVR